MNLQVSSRHQRPDLPDEAGGNANRVHGNTHARVARWGGGIIASLGAIAAIVGGIAGCLSWSDLHATNVEVLQATVSDTPSLRRLGRSPTSRLESPETLAVTLMISNEATSAVSITDADLTVKGRGVIARRPEYVSSAVTADGGLGIAVLPDGDPLPLNLPGRQAAVRTLLFTIGPKLRLGGVPAVPAPPPPPPGPRAPAPRLEVNLRLGGGTDTDADVVVLREPTRSIDWDAAYRCNRHQLRELYLTYTSQRPPAARLVLIRFWKLSAPGGPMRLSRPLLGSPLPDPVRVPLRALPDGSYQWVASIGTEWIAAGQIRLPLDTNACVAGMPPPTPLPPPGRVPLPSPPPPPPPPPS